MGELVKVIKNYRKPRRRPAHLRTKTGCLTSLINDWLIPGKGRQRKKKCDENLVVCHNCSRRKIDCIWPSQPSWKKDSNASLTENDDSPTPSPVAEFSSINNRLQAIEDDDERTFTYLSTTSASSSPRSNDHDIDDDDKLPVVVARQLSSVSSNTKIHSTGLFDYMRMVFVPQLVRPDTDSQYIEDFTRGSLQLAFNVPFFMDALLACSAAEIKENDAFHLRLAESHYAKAVCGMRTYLATRDDSLLAEITALRTVIILCVYERTRLYLSQGVSTHLCGAAALLKSCCKRMEASRNTPDSWVATQTLSLESFVFHVATSIPFQDPSPIPALVNEVFPSALLILERLWRENKMDYPYSPVLGAPPMLFAYVRQVALLYSQFRRQRFDMRQCQSLEQDLRRWSDDNIANSYTVKVVDFADFADNSLCLTCPSDLQDANQSFFGPKLYVLAARILLKRMMTLSSETRGQCPSTSLSVLLSEAILLVRSIEPSMDYFAEYYCWPFYCLGVSIDDADNQELLMTKIMGFWKTTRNGTMRRLADILTDEWTCSLS